MVNHVCFSDFTAEFQLIFISRHTARPLLIKKSKGFPSKSSLLQFTVPGYPTKLKLTPFCFPDSTDSPTERLQREERGEAVPVHGLARPRGARVSHTHPGLPSAGKGLQSSRRRAHGGPLQVGVQDKLTLEDVMFSWQHNRTWNLTLLKYPQRMFVFNVNNVFWPHDECLCKQWNLFISLCSSPSAPVWAGPAVSLWLTPCWSAWSTRSL